jgi:hypothetical protein
VNRLLNLTYPKDVGDFYSHVAHGGGGWRSRACVGAVSGGAACVARFDAVYMRRW